MDNIKKIDSVSDSYHRQRPVALNLSRLAAFSWIVVDPLFLWSTYVSFSAVWIAFIMCLSFSRNTYFVH
jgi:hypothetical protein